MKYLKKIFESDKIEADNIYYLDIGEEDIKQYLYTLLDESSWYKIYKGFLTPYDVGEEEFMHQDDISLEIISKTENTYANGAIKIDMSLKTSNNNIISYDHIEYSSIVNLVNVSNELEEIKSRLGSDYNVSYSFTKDLLSLIIYKNIN